MVHGGLPGNLSIAKNFTGSERAALRLTSSSTSTVPRRVAMASKRVCAFFATMADAVHSRHALVALDRRLTGLTCPDCGDACFHSQAPECSSHAVLPSASDDPGTDIRRPPG